MAALGLNQLKARDVHRGAVQAQGKGGLQLVHDEIPHRFHLRVHGAVADRGCAALLVFDREV